MRDVRLSVALAFFTSFFLAGCAGVRGEASAPTEPASSAEVVAPKVATTKSETASNSAADKSAAPAAEPERAAPPSAARDDSLTPSSRLVAQLNDATREIAILRASNAKLKAIAAQPAPAPAPVREPDPADVKLAASFRSYAQFKQELAGFFAEVEKLRAENATLNAKLRDVASGSQDAKATLAKLEAELKSEKSAHAQAEQTAVKLREQLRAAAAPRVHTVKDGETLETIADQYYGDATKWKLILDANRGRLPLDGAMPAGLELEIPAK